MYLRYSYSYSYRLNVIGISIIDTVGVRYSYWYIPRTDKDFSAGEIPVDTSTRTRTVFLRCQARREFPLF